MSDLKYVHTEVAPSFGSVSGSSKEVDEKLERIMANIINSLNQQNDKSWDAVLDTIEQNQRLDTFTDSITSQTGSLVKEADLKKGKGSEAFVNSLDEIGRWCERFVSDDDVISTTTIKSHTLSELIWRDDFSHGFDNALDKTNDAKKLIDIGILRVPDVEDPHYKVYWIQLTTVWTITQAGDFMQATNTIEAVYKSRTFRLIKGAL